MRFFAAIGLLILPLAASMAADFEFYGRSGDAIELDFRSLPGVTAGPSFSNATLTGGSEHTLLSSSDLGQGSFAFDGRLWLFADPEAQGDTDASARGYQGRVEGSFQIGSETMTFAVNVVPGYTGAGDGAVGQNLERVGRRNNRLHVAQQQQRLRYLGFRRDSGEALPAVDGVFGTGTDEALKTFQAAFVSSASSVNVTQAGVDGIVGPNTAGWLNAANAPAWVELIDPDPQSIRGGGFSLSRLRGDFDIWPSRDPGTGARTGRTPQIERFGTSWTINLIEQGTALAKQRTGATQMINAISTLDGYDSSAVHSTHRAGMDIDMHVDAGAHGTENGSISTAEQRVIDVVAALVDAGVAGDAHTGRLARVFTGNNDVITGVRNTRPAVGALHDPQGFHETHLHLDVAAPSRVAGVANVAGDLNLDGVVDAADYTVWRDMDGLVYDASDYAAWSLAFGQIGATNGAAIPEPAAAGLIAASIASAPRRRRR